jgi:hypothetical protein
VVAVRQRRSRLPALAAALACAWVLGAILAAPAGAAFGITHFDGAVLKSPGVASTQAGEHPSELVTEIEFALTTDYAGRPIPDGDFKDVETSLPAGLVGNPLATPRCTIPEFRSNSLETGCSSDAAVGFVELASTESTIYAPIYNLRPEPDEPALFGFHILTASAFMHASVRSGGNYGLDVDIPNVSQALPLYGAKLTLWGVPAEGSHNGMRGHCLGTSGPSGAECPSLAQPRPFLTNPSLCGGATTTELRADSWQEPGVEHSASFRSHEPGGGEVGIEGCAALEFAPAFDVKLTPAVADSPAGAEIEVTVPQDEIPNHLATPELKKAAITLPEGVSVNAAAANGLGACTEAQIGLKSAGAAGCPDSSKLGTVNIQTPLLEDPLRGAVYLARQGENPFGSLLAIYLVAEADGVRVKLPGRIDTDATSGRVTATFDDLPQLPFSALDVKLFSGPAGVLAAPSTCGSGSATGSFTAWSEGSAVVSSPSVAVEGGPGGTCPTGAFAPRLNAGTIGSAAGSFSPFLLDVTRDDGTQRLSGVDLKLPKGLLARLAGIPYCPDSVLAGFQPSPGAGAVAAASGACTASQVGTVAVAAGVGPSPFFLSGGRAYLAGPYKGAPVSLALVVPALAGPFDLGAVVVRVALKIDPETAQVEAVSDPLPTILSGIPLNLREVRVALDRPGFILDPTSCGPAAIGGSLSGAGGASAPVSVRYQATGCAGLRFGPKLALAIKGATKRGRYPAFTATLTAGAGEANLASASVALPHSEFLAQNHLSSLCNRTVFAEGTPGSHCPAASVYGQAIAYSPLLDAPLEGPVYLRPSGNTLPDLVATLNGQISIVLDGRIDSVRGGIRTTFEGIPDAPISKFVLSMKGGKKGLLTNSRSLCAAPNLATVKITGQNGLSVSSRPKIKVACRKKRKKKH